MSPLRILHAAAECFPLAKTGGLGDVVSALPSALRGLDCDARVALPAYRGVQAALGETQAIAQLRVNAVEFTVRRGALADGLPVYLFDAPVLFDRAGTPYADENHQPFADSAFRFGTFSAAVAAFVQQGAIGFAPDVVHLHDWQVALAAPWLAASASRPRIVFTIHNLAYQGQFGREAFDALQLQAYWFTPDALEFWGGFSCMKGGLNFADAITTVSPTYAQEIRTPAFGCGLEGLLQQRADKLSGILNGIDDAVWNPARDPHLAQRYDASTVETGKRANRLAVSQVLGIAVDEQVPLAVFIGRLADQKGADLLLAAREAIQQLPVQLIVLASGDSALEAALRDWALASAGKVTACITHNEALAHQLTAAADLLLMPSRFEPCGLNQLYALRYGTMPLVRRTGGLADTVVDATAQTLADGSATGVSFENADVGGVLWALQRGIELHADPITRGALRRNGMARDFGWAASARQYRQLYQTLLTR